MCRCQGVCLRVDLCACGSMCLMFCVFELLMSKFMYVLDLSALRAVYFRLSMLNVHYYYYYYYYSVDLSASEGNVAGPSLYSSFFR